MKPWELLEALGSLGSSVILRCLSPFAPPMPSHFLLLPLTPWASLGPWDLAGASGSLGHLWKPSAPLGLQSYLGAFSPHLLSDPLTPLAPSLFPLTTLTPSHPLLTPNGQIRVVLCYTIFRGPHHLWGGQGASWEWEGARGSERERGEWEGARGVRRMWY